MATLSQLINAKAIAIAKLAVRATTAAGSGHLDQRAKELGVAAISKEEMARGLPIAQPAPTLTAPPPARPLAGFMATVAGNTKVAKSVEEKKAQSLPVGTF